jgi:hypothetical protein
VHPCPGPPPRARAVLRCAQSQIDQKNQKQKVIASDSNRKTRLKAGRASATDETPPAENAEVREARLGSDGGGSVRGAAGMFQEKINKKEQNQVGQR